MSNPSTVCSLTILDFGRANIDLGVVMAPGDLDGQWAVCAFPGYLVALDDGRRILIDTGPNRRHIREPMYEYSGTSFADHLQLQMTEADDPRHRLAELGLTEADIDILVLTHTHFDHAGNAGDFTKSEIVIHRDAYADGRDRAERGVAGGLPETGADGQPLNFRFIDGDSELVPGVTLLHTPGHANGHLSVLLRLPETGVVILAIDAIYSRANRDASNYKIGANPTQGIASADRLVALAEQENALLIYGHDPNQWQQLKKAPEKYA
jgi:N-acyl homoserine lactone hydrolase